MNPAIVASLSQILTTFGIPMFQYFVGLYRAGADPKTQAQLDAIVADVLQLSQYRSTDSLTAAGIKIVDGKVVPL